MDIGQEALELHEKLRGKIEVISRVAVETRHGLSLAYTPGVARPCLEIQKDADKSYAYTRRGNLVLVVTDGTAVLGLGDIGPEAAMPVMEGKCVLLKEFGGVDAFPLCIRSKDADEIVNTIKLIAGSFGGINLEDIAAPRCFEIERKLKEVCDIPVFHDDQHGTAVVVVAALINALKIVGKKPGEIKIAMNGAGAAGIATAKLLLKTGVREIIMCDIEGSITRAVRGADVFVGLSAPGTVTADMIRTMNKDAVVFAMANPTPEIFPDEAKAGGARVAGTGRSDFPNQINNVLAFPGIFRGALDVRASDINDEMNLAAAYAIAALVDEDELNEEFIVPDALDRRVGAAVAKAVAGAARKSGVARI